MSRTRYAARCDALLSELADAPARYDVSGAATGLHVLARLPDLSPCDLARLVRLAADREVGVYPTAPYYLTPNDAPTALLFGFATLDPVAIRAGLRRLADAFREL